MLRGFSVIGEVQHVKSLTAVVSIQFRDNHRCFMNKV